MKEFIFGFLNYNSGSKLSYMTSPESLQMNCDYAVANLRDKPYYDKYYTELAADEDWGFRLLKRKQAIERELIYENKGTGFNGNYEYYNAFEKLDTTFNSINPLQAEFEMSFDKVPAPLNAFLVMQISSVNEAEPEQFIRVPLNLITYNWNGLKNYKIELVSGNLPLKVKRIVCYLWNIDKQEITIQLNAFRLYRLNGEGVTEISKAKG